MKEPDQVVPTQAASNQALSNQAASNQRLIDEQLSPSRTVDRLEHYLWLYGEQSRLVRAEFGSNAHLDVSYGPDPRHTLDVFPCGINGAPLLVFVHGGFWQALSKNESSFPAMACRSAGVHFAALSYRLGQTTPLASIVDDVRDALASLGERADEIGFDSSRVVVAGHSAGAHLAAMVAATGGTGTIDIAGISLIGGVFDLEVVRQSYVNDVMQLSPEVATAFSPVTLPPPPCPALITYAELDTDEFVRQSIALAEAWSPTAMLEPAQLGLNHFNSPLDLADPDSRLFRHTVDLVS